VYGMKIRIGHSHHVGRAPTLSIGVEIRPIAMRTLNRQSGARIVGSLFPAAIPQRATWAYAGAKGIWRQVFQHRPQLSGLGAIRGSTPDRALTSLNPYLNAPDFVRAIR
jgi:hypothetical protein